MSKCEQDNSRKLHSYKAAIRDDRKSDEINMIDEV